MSGRTVYLVPPSGEEPDVFFEPLARRDEIARPYVLLREEIEKAGYKVACTQNAQNLTDFAALFSLANMSQQLLQNLHRYPSEKCVIAIYEPPSNYAYMYDRRLGQFFKTILTMFDDIVDNKLYYKFYHPQPHTEKIDNIPDFTEKKFCIMVQANLTSSHPDELYSERAKLAKFLANEEFDLYGRLWEGYSAFKGRLVEKKPVIKNYKFFIAYENMRNQRGYVTERIFDAFYGGTVPVYWGADNITDYVPKECFIDRREFTSNEDLLKFLKSVDKKQYDAYLEAIDAYIKGPQGFPFSGAGFAKLITNSILNAINKR
ncbi:MAG: hypothetical protein JSS32_09625 [Verrucomicrobia bacterium]|nr:hypothetical protein [Verrucomicrobiota bacterium]